MQFHPVAELFPMMSAVDFDMLCLDIASSELREPILLAIDPADNIEKIADGRNRYNACTKVGKEPKYRKWNGKGSLVDIVVSLNLKRRHLSESQRAMVAAKLANMRSGERTDLASNEARLSQGQAAKLLNTSRSSVQRAAKVLKSGEPEIVEWVQQGDLTVAEASDLAELPEEKRKKIIKKGRRGAKEILGRIKEEAVKKAAHGKATCLVCGPAVEDTDANFLAALQLVGQVFPTHARYLTDALEEMAQEDLSDSTRKNYDRILAAIKAGDAEHNDCRRATGLTITEFDHTIAVMIDYNMIRVNYQGGKTDNARGARKKIYHIVEAEAGEDLTYEMFDEESDKEFFGV